MLLGLKEVAVKSFICGLKEKIETRLANKNFNELQEAINATVAIEKSIKESDQRKEYS